MLNTSNSFISKGSLFIGVLGLLIFSSCKKTELVNPVAVENVSKKPNKPSPPPLDRFELPETGDSTITETPGETFTETPGELPGETFTETPGETPSGTPTETNTEYPTETEGGQASCPKDEYPIYAGAGGNDVNKGTNVGKVTYSNDGTNLYVTATFDGATCPSEIHLWAGTDLSAVTGSGGVAFGSFPYKEDNATCGTYTYTIPLQSIGAGCNQTVYIILHAAMNGTQTEEGTTDGETAIAYGDQTLGGARWGWAADYTICCE